ncbi:MAG: nucleotide exchange factor GrpE [Candidatus Paceibacterota bacterium]
MTKKEEPNKTDPKKNIDLPKDQLEGLKKLLEQSEAEKKEYFAGWQREKADFINYKNKELERLEKFSDLEKENFFLKILPILDNLNRAEKAIPEESKQDQNIKGLLMIKNQLENVLKTEGLIELDCLGKKFDPNMAEAMELIEDSEQEPGTVIEELEKGYCFNNKIIRPAKVKIIK